MTSTTLFASSELRNIAVATAALVTVAGLLLVVANPSFASRPLAAIAIVASTLFAILSFRSWPAETALVLLTVFVFTNLSEVLVRYHGLPSLLQLVVLPLGVLAWLVTRRTSVAALLTHPLTIALAAWSLMIFFSSLRASHPELTDARLSSSLKALAVYLLVALLVSSVTHVRLMVVSILVAGAAVSILPILQNLSGDYDSSFGGFARVELAHLYGDVFEQRVAGPLGDPNFFAQLLLIPIPFAVLYASIERRIGVRALYYLAAAIVLLALMLTYSRGAIVALAVLALLMMITLRVRWRRLAVTMGVLILALLAFRSELANRIATMEQLVVPGAASYADSSVQKRRLLAATAWTMFLDRPLAGVGAGNFSVHYDEHSERVGSSSRLYDEPGGDHFPHSLPLEIAAESGLVGLILFGSIIVIAFVSLRRVGRVVDRADTLSITAAGLRIGIAGYLVAALFLHAEFQRSLWMLFGLIPALQSLGEQKAQESPS
ncbi:MAG TPA: O-antigen ligase family protein [Thermoanaerobaculia bacterium]|nr:O-antigen ligase family protein [Thermoanaerobaculia bacterium]